MESYDVAVIGGGPAGISTALSLLALDPGLRHRVLVIEKAVHPRHKLCAGGLTPLALQQLRRLGLRLTIPYITARQAVFSFQGHTIRLPGKPAIVVTRRQQFDAWLAEAAEKRAVQIRQGVQVGDLERVQDGLLLHTDNGHIHAKVLIGADGSRGITRSWLGYRESPPRVARLLEVVTPVSGAEPEFVQSFARFEFTPTLEGLQGYYWDFPSLIDERPNMNRGVFDARISPGSDRAPLLKILNDSARASGVGDQELAPDGHPIHWFSPRNRLSAERVLLVGDAAGAEPLFGEGIGIALAYGELAAAEAHRALLSDEFAFGNYRRRVLMSPLGRYLLFRWFVASLLYRFARHAPLMRFVWVVGQGLRRLYGSLPSVPGVLQ